MSDSDKKQYCSEPLQVPGAAPLKVGDHVVVAVALMGIGGGSAIEVYIVTSPAPAPRLSAELSGHHPGWLEGLLDATAEWASARE